MRNDSVKKAGYLSVKKVGYFGNINQGVTMSLDERWAACGISNQTHYNFKSV